MSCARGVTKFKMAEVFGTVEKYYSEVIKKTSDFKTSTEYTCDMNACVSSNVKAIMAECHQEVLDK